MTRLPWALPRAGWTAGPSARKRPGDRVIRTRFAASSLPRAGGVYVPRASADKPSERPSKSADKMAGPAAPRASGARPASGPGSSHESAFISSKRSARARSWSAALVWSASDLGPSLTLRVTMSGPSLALRASVAGSSLKAGRVVAGGHASLSPAESAVESVVASNHPTALGGDAARTTGSAGVAAGAPEGATGAGSNDSPLAAAAAAAAMTRKTSRSPLAALRLP